MKTQLFQRLAFGLAGLALVVGTTRMAIPADAPQSPPASDISAGASNTATAGVAATTASSANYSASTNLAPLAPPASTPDVRLSQSAAEIAKLAQAGLGDDVMMAYVANVNSSFNLGSDQIVYLNDLGVSGAVVKAMIQRDAALQAASANSLAALMPPATNSNLPAPDNSGQIPPLPQMDNLGAAPPPYDTGDYANAPVSEADYFYNSLAPYGNWLYVGGVGVCWQPTVCLANHDWRPYGDRGRWLYSDCGWYWQSDYSWGWAAFHYGRWFRDASSGWVWAPDHIWAPAWVSWRLSSDYCGWAPLPPAAHFAPGFGLTFGSHLAGANFEFGLRPEQYTFIPIARLSDYNPARYAAPAWQVQELHAQTALANHFVFQNNRVVNQNIDPQTVATLARTDIRRAEILEVPGQANQPVQPERLTKRSGSMVILTPQLPAPSFHRSATTVNPGGSRAPFGPAGGNSGPPRSSFSPAQSSAPAVVGAVPSAARSETYPAGSQVFNARRDAYTPLPANPAAPSVVRQDSNRSPAGFNFDGNYNRPDFNEHFAVPAATRPAQTTYAAPPSQTPYAMPGRFTVSQQLSAPSYNGGYIGVGPAATTDHTRSEPAQFQNQPRFQPDNAPAQFHQRNEPSYQPVAPQPARQEVPNLQREETAQHFAPPVPAPAAPQPVPQPASSAPSSSVKR
jgi:hypothetical protein